MPVDIEMPVGIEITVDIKIPTDIKRPVDIKTPVAKEHGKNAVCPIARYSRFANTSRYYTFGDDSSEVLMIVYPLSTVQSTPFFTF